MMSKKYVWGIFVIGLFSTILFPGNNILWDFGVEIKPPILQNKHEDISHCYSANQKGPQTVINAVITDPFVPPVKSTLSSQVSALSVSTLPEKIMELILLNMRLT